MKNTAEPASRFAFPIFAALVAIMLAWWLRHDSSDPSSVAAPEGLTETTEELTPRHEVLDPVRVAVADPPPSEGPAEAAETSNFSGPSVSKQEFLQEYWGADWGFHLSRLTERGLDPDDLDFAVVVADIPSWEEIAPLLEASMVLEQFGGIEDDRTGHEKAYQRYAVNFGIDLGEEAILNIAKSVGVEKRDVDIAYMRNVAASYSASMERAGHRAADAEVELRKRIWEEKLYSVGPVYPVGGPDFLQSSGPGASVITSLQNWVIEYRIDPSLSPELESAMGALVRLRRDRNAVLRQALGG